MFVKGLRNVELVYCSTNGECSLRNIWTIIIIISHVKLKTAAQMPACFNQTRQIIHITVHKQQNEWNCTEMICDIILDGVHVSLSRRLSVSHNGQNVQTTVQTPITQVYNLYNATFWLHSCCGPYLTALLEHGAYRIMKVDFHDHLRPFSMSLQYCLMEWQTLLHQSC